MPITLTATQSGAQETKNVYNGSKVKTGNDFFILTTGFITFTN